ncbi:MAG TPA: hypothetical protein VJ023_01285 [Pyrinomonadaceae bacterium]|nr:hypothetical protein [Pyrinomonadaceae bacterium]
MAVVAEVVTHLWAVLSAEVVGFVAVVHSVLEDHSGAVPHCAVEDHCVVGARSLLADQLFVEDWLVEVNLAFAAPGRNELADQFVVAAHAFHSFWALESELQAVALMVECVPVFQPLVASPSAQGEAQPHHAVVQYH